MNKKFYSQNGEDYLLYKFFDEKEEGFYVDVGAFDGVHLSNSYAFEKLGWKGICVEGNPRYHEICYKNRPNTLCLNVACVGDPNQKSVEFFTEELGLLSGIKPVDNVKERYENRGIDFTGFVKLNVKAMTLSDIMIKHLGNNKIDFLSIDVEGTELDVLRGIDLKTYSPRVLAIEAHNDLLVNVIDNYILSENNYHKGREVKQNLFYLRDKKDVKSLNEIQIDCEIEKTIHPLGEAYTIYGKALQKNEKKRFKGYWKIKKMIKILKSI